MTSSDAKRVAAIRDLLDTAQKSIHSARKLLLSLDGMDGEALKADLGYLSPSSLSSYKSGNEKIVE